MCNFAMFYLILIFTLILGYCVIYKRSYGKNLPPGPRGLPIIGFLPFLRKDAFKQFHEMTRKYGKIFMVKIGPRNILILNDWKNIKEALVVQGDTFAGRAPTFAFKQIVHDKDVAMSDGPIGKQQRRFTMSILKDFGFGRVGSETIVAEEVEHMTNLLRKKSGQLIAMEEIIFMAILNVTWYIVSGQRYQFDDEFMLKFKSVINLNFQFINSVSLWNFYPVLRHVDPMRTYQKFMNNHYKIWEFLTNSVHDHKKTIDTGNESRDFIDAYLKEIISRKDETQKSLTDTHPFTEERLICTLYDLFNAGLETTASTLSWGILYMVLWPEIQTKVQEEIDRVIGKGRLPVYSDHNELPYVAAVLFEIQRLGSIVPLSLPHRVTKDTKLFDYDIPRDTEVLPNLWAVHHDSENWEDPDVFRPERFLDTNNNSAKQPEYLVPFSVGPRYCLGERLAKLTMFVFFTALFQNFKMRLPVGVPPPSMEPVVGLNLRPNVFSVILESRI